MRLRRIGVLVCGVLVLLGAMRGGLAGAAEEEKGPFAAADAQILSEISEHSEAAGNLEYLSDSIGARLTGSPQLKQANEWTRDMFAKYGAVNAHLEGWTMERSWARGKASARIVSPTEHPLTIAAAGWSPSTPGAVTGPVVYFDAKEQKDFAKFHGKLKGAIVIYQEPASLSPSKPDDPHAQLSRPMQQPPPRIGEPPVEDPFAAFQKTAKERAEFWKQEGVAAVLRDSNKPHGLLNMTDVSLARYDIGPIPTAFVTGEGYRMIFRLLGFGHRLDRQRNGFDGRAGSGARARKTESQTQAHHPLRAVFRRRARTLRLATVRKNAQKRVGQSVWSSGPRHRNRPRAHPRTPRQLSGSRARRSGSRTSPRARSSRAAHGPLFRYRSSFLRRSRRAGIFLHTGTRGVQPDPSQPVRHL